jgi:hypothetical protein
LTAQGSDLPGRAQQFVSNAAVGTRGKRVEFVIDFLNHQIATKRYEALVALKLKFAAGVRVRFRHETTLIADGTKASFRGIAKQLAPGGGASQPAPGTVPCTWLPQRPVLHGSSAVRLIGSGYGGDPTLGTSTFSAMSALCRLSPSVAGRGDSGPLTQRACS